MENITRDRRWLGLFAVLTAMIMNILDSTIVNVASPSIHRDLGGSYASLQWISAAYTLALAVGLLTGGRLGDLYGRKRMLMIGAVGFIVASLACAAAVSPDTLIGARAAQGLFGAVMIPQAFGLIRDLFPPQEIGKAFGALGPVIGLSTVLGPIVAGVLIHADILGTGWRMAFAINLPLGLFTLIAGAKALPVAAREVTKGIDVIGALLAAAGMFLLVYPLVEGRDLGWPGWLLGMIALAVVLLAGFVVYQLRRARSGRTPLVELGVFARRSYAAGVAFVLVFFGSIVGFSLSVGLFLQLGLGMSPLRASLTMVAWAAGAFVGSGISATVMGKLGRRILHIGLVLMAAGLIGIYLVFRDIGTSVGGWDLTAPLAIFGLGMGMIFVPLFDIIMGEVRDREIGSASSLLESVQQLGASLGVAVLGTVFFAVIGSRPHLATFLVASQRITLITLGLTVAAFALGFLLPKHARHAALMAAPSATDSATDSTVTEAAELANA
jgi:EmrB/QacA subfamily drug resistance transporter